MEGDAGETLTLGGDAWVSTTSSVEMGQLPLVTVQRSEALVPWGIPVTEDVGDEGVIMVAVPLTKDQAPVPPAGALAPSVKLPALQTV